MVLVYAISYVKHLIYIAESLPLFLLSCRIGKSFNLQKVVSCLVQYARK